MDEKLIKEYINNLVLQVNTVTQESIVLKTRLQVMEKEKNRLAETNKDLAEELDALKFQQQEEEKENKPEIENVIEEEPKVEKKIPKYVREPKPKGYNPKVDGPRKLMPNPEFTN